MVLLRHMGRIVLIGVIVLSIATVFVLYGSRNLSEAPTLEDQAATSTAPAATYTGASEDDIVVTSPAAGGEVQGTLHLTGEARGHWYFEASFPVEVLAADGSSLVEAPVSADGDWMTVDFVPFSADIDLSGYEGDATVVLHRDNPSGVADFDASVSIPITIVATPDNTAEADGGTTTTVSTEATEPQE